MNAPQYFTAPDSTEMVIISRVRYEVLLAAEEELQDIAAAEAGRELIVRDGGIPSPVSKLIALGYHPIAAWRKFRRMSQARVAEAAGVTQAAIARLEAQPPGAGLPETLDAVAKALDAPRWTLEGESPKTPREKFRRAMSRQGDPKTGRVLRAAIRKP